MKEKRYRSVVLRLELIVSDVYKWSEQKPVSDTCPECRDTLCFREDLSVKLIAEVVKKSGRKVPALEAQDCATSTAEDKKGTRLIGKLLVRGGVQKYDAERSPLVVCILHSCAPILRGYWSCKSGEIANFCCSPDTVHMARWR